MAAGLREEFLRLLREDEEFRYAVMGLLGFGEVLRRLDANTEAIRRLQEQVRSLQEQMIKLQEQVRSLQEQVAKLQEQVARHSEAIRSLQEQVAENTKAIRSLQEQVVEHNKILGQLASAVRDLASKIASIGNRYGVFTEEAFRESVKYLIEDLLKAYQVERWVRYDEEGLVYGHPSVVEADVLIRDRERILVEYKASADRADVAELYRIGRLYEKLEKVRPRLLLVSPAIRKRCVELAKKLGVELRGSIVE